jgi:hypothetical protein
METNLHPMYAHTQASLREKVEILATNPYRYYVAPNLWIGQNASRVRELDSLLQQAKLEADDLLCERILEVQQQLRVKYKIDF